MSDNIFGRTKFSSLLSDEIFVLFGSVQAEANRSNITSNMLDEVLDECCMNVGCKKNPFSHYHPTYFFQHLCSFILIFLSHSIGNKMADNMLLPVVLSELIDSDDEKPHRGE